MCLRLGFTGASPKLQLSFHHLVGEPQRFLEHFSAEAALDVPSFDFSFCSMELLRHGFFWGPFDFDLCLSNHRWFLLCKILKSLPYLICYKKDAVIDKGSAHRAFCVSFPRFGSSLRASRAFSTFAARSTCSFLFAFLASVSLCFLANASVHGLHIVV